MCLTGRQTWTGVCTLILIMATAPARSAWAEPTSPLAASQDGGEVVRLTTDGVFKQRPAWSPDGSWLAFSRHEGATIFLYLLSADGTRQRRLTKRTNPEYDAVWSPDGRRLAFSFVNISPNQGDVEVYTIGIDGDDLAPLAVTGKKLSHEESPHWSPDGRWITYSSTRHGNQEIYMSRTDGSDTRRLTSDPAIDAHPAWSPDGRKLVFATNRWGDLELAVVRVADAKITRLTTSRGLDDYPVWSSDGKQIAFTSNRTGNLEIFTIDPDGGSPHNATRNPAIDNFPTWTKDGGLTFVSNRDDGFDIYTMGANRVARENHSAGQEVGVPSTRSVNGQ